MNQEKNLRNPIAVIADIHGNRWALEAVLHDIDRRGNVRQIINLGDHLTGPLDPVGTVELLLTRDMLNIYGNDDRDLFLSEAEQSLSQKFTHERLSSSHLNWLQMLPESAVVAEELFACHGDLFDAPYVLEQVDASGVTLRRTGDIEASVANIAQPVILCGHSHVPRTIFLPSGKLIVNPGSVGMPAYTMDVPVPYAMESGSPHARYALIRKVGDQWQVEHVLVPYDWEHVANVARANLRFDWAEWLATGRAS